MDLRDPSAIGPLNSLLQTENDRKVPRPLIKHGIVPQTIIKPIESTLVTAAEADYFKVPLELEDIEGYSAAQIDETINRLEFEMREHAKKFEFEKAAELRDRIKFLRERELIVA